MKTLSLGMSPFWPTLNRITFPLSHTPPPHSSFGGEHDLLKPVRAGKDWIYPHITRILTESYNFPACTRISSYLHTSFNYRHYLKLLDRFLNICCRAWYHISQYCPHFSFHCFLFLLKLHRKRPLLALGSYYWVISLLFLRIMPGLLRIITRTLRTV